MNPGVVAAVYHSGSLGRRFDAKGNGQTVPVTDEHTWGEWEIADETQHKHTCELCGKEETNKHTWDEGTVTIEPSGGREGETTYTCTACGVRCIGMPAPAEARETRSLMHGMLEPFSRKRPVRNPEVFCTPARYAVQPRARAYLRNTHPANGQW